jgi:TRAP-type C4-dicarboxylate transport system permease small subunit
VGIPVGVMVLVTLAIVLGAVLTVARRDDFGQSGLRSAWVVFEESVAQILMLVMLLAATIQVASRFLLAKYVTISWTEELALLAMVWLTFWAGAAVGRKQEHINLSIVYDFMPSAMKRVARIIGALVAIAVLAPIVWFGFSNAELAGAIATVTLGVPVSVYAYAVPVAMSLMLVHSIVDLVRCVRDPMDGLGHPDDSVKAVAEHVA